ncbi:putative NTPase (NACHT family) [Xenococcus sp. PCC 7305]|uniref:GUN4 domain-containing protein n=1 Tax=Xenococcus sp. PCC 7305 TaxID=102125 RepID=UPI0002AC336B|nr:GUN4 domain-containing protein [Xenococcus sp. PCC 7305]ELS04076.1 putative NTPase (NACHT family) [Xenococcus sp. PCC 7305]
MTDSSPQPQPQSNSVNLDSLWKFLSSQYVSKGAPGILLGIVITQASQANWVKAAQFASAAVLVWFLSKIARKLLPKVDRAVEQTIDAAIDRAEKKVEHRTEIIPFKKQYLEALKTYCYALEVEGFRGNLPRLPLKDIFVPLRLNSDPDAKPTDKMINKIWELLPREHQTKPQPINSRLVIIADPGYGKTTLTRYLTLSYADGSYKNEQAKNLIPILLLFRTIHPQIQNNNTPTLPDLITQQILILPRCQNLTPSSRWVEDWLQSGQCLVMLDGLDEVPQSQREKVSKWVNWQMQAYDATFILTSRPHGYDSSLFKAVQPVKIIDFDNDQISDFITKWYRNRIGEQWDYLYQRSLRKPEGERLTLEYVEAQSTTEAEEAAADLNRQLFALSALVNLAKNPLLVTIIAATHEILESLPKERTSLYRKILNLLLESRPNRRETRLTMPEAKDNQAVLQSLASNSLEQGQLQFTSEQARPWIEAKLSEKSGDPTFTPKKFLQEIQNIAGILAGGTEEEGLYQFTHKTFQEYLAAIEFQEKQQENILIEQFYNPDWQEVIVFYSNLTSAKAFLEFVLDNFENSPDKKYALELARRLVEEGGKIDEQIHQRLDRALERVDLGDELNAAISLEKKFRNLNMIDNKTSISEPITWGEYQLFLNDQASGQFHSSAEILPIVSGQENQPVREISQEDAQWFCAWLSTQAHLQSEDIVYDYRLPSNGEIEQSARKGITSSSSIYSDDFLRVIRVVIPHCYQALLNYLANGRWREADEETRKVMLKVADREEQGLLNEESIKNFPCGDLRMIDQLWVKYSKGKFGFSVQKEIYESLGGDTRSYNREVFEKFYDRVGWKQGGDWVSYGDYTFNLYAPHGHLPYRGGDWVSYGYFLFSRAKTCSL